MSKTNSKVLEELNFQYRLTKPDLPEFVKSANKIGWIKWNENGTFNELSPDIQIDTSLIMDPHFGEACTWMTTDVTEIIEQTDDYILFKTKNSLYKLEYTG